MEVKERIKKKVDNLLENESTQSLEKLDDLLESWGWEEENRSRREKKLDTLQNLSEEQRNRVHKAYKNSQNPTKRTPHEEVIQETWKKLGLSRGQTRPSGFTKG